MTTLSKNAAQINQSLLETLDNQPHETFGWDDFDFSVNNLRINPSTSKPDFNYNEAEYLFDAASTETVVGAKISKHAYKTQAAEWRPHIHWAQSNAGVVKWQLEYKIWAANTAEPASFSTIVATVPEFAYTTGTIHQITEFSPVNMSSYTSAALYVKVKISRLGGDVADTYTGDARFMGFDFHVPIDQPRGSRDEFTK